MCVKEREMGCRRHKQNAVFVVFMFSPGTQSLMILLYRQYDYSHHSSAQWKPWEALLCLSEPITFMAGKTECRQFKVGFMLGFALGWRDDDACLIYKRQEKKAPISCLIHVPIILYRLSCDTCTRGDFTFYVLLL